MNIHTTLEHVSTHSKNTMLATLLSHAFENNHGELDIDKEILTEFLSLFKEEALKLISDAEDNFSKLQSIDNLNEGSLDNMIHDNFSAIASDINDGGVGEQARYLMVEVDWNPNQIKAAAEADNEELREIPCQ